MTGFQHFAVDTANGPHVTLLAGVEMAGCYWATTSSSAAKVRMIRSNGRAAVLAAGDDPCDHGDWTLIAGRATILDTKRPCDWLVDPLAAGLAGIAVARIGLSNIEQLIGYLHDRDDVPSTWQPTSRVLLVVHGDHRLAVRAGRIVESTGAFAGTVPLPLPARRRRHRLDRSHLAGLSSQQMAVVRRSGRCALGLSTAVGPIVVPGMWDANGATVRLDRRVLTHLRADLPGECSVTLDESADARPTRKVGVMLRGSASLLDDGRTADLNTDTDAAEHRSAVLSINVERLTAWEGFATSTASAS